MRLEEILKQKADNFENFNEKYPSFFKNLQANILKHHGKPEAILAFLTFKFKNDEKRKTQFKDWLKNLDITSAREQFLNAERKETLFQALINPSEIALTEKEKIIHQLLLREEDLQNLVNDFKESNKSMKGIKKRIEIFNQQNKIELEKSLILKNIEKKFPPVITCFYLSYDGYKYIEQTAPEDESNSFSQGLLKRTVYGENNPKEMDAIFRDHYDENEPEKKIHALLLIASNENALNLQEKRKILKQELGQFCDINFEFAKLIEKTPEKNQIEDLKNGKSVEWFGYRDGISNPRFFPNPIESNRPDFEEPSLLNLALKPCFGASPHSAGSFLVFLKLQQNTSEFEETCKKLAASIYNSNINNLKQEQIDFSGALLLGRHKDGTPLTQANTPVLGHSNNMNKFNYSNDVDGTFCPLHAHIRKANPREGNESRKIVRRGMSYGNYESKEKGLFFMSFQRNLGYQFEYVLDSMNQNWGNGKYTGKDPLISKYSNYRKYSKTWGSNSEQIDAPVGDLITFKGGLYFFAPSISYLKINLGEYL